MRKQSLATKDGENNVVFPQNGVYTFTDVDKYDIDGNEYVYYVKESLGSSSIYNDYSISYSNTGNSDESQASDNSKAFNGGVIRNMLDGVRVFTIDATWIAAARQGGTAEVTYAIEVWDQTLNNGAGGWKTATYKTPQLDEHGQPVTDGNGNVVMVDTNAEQTVGNFSAEQMHQTITLDQMPMPTYDENGAKYQYRIVQTHVKRTDNLVNHQSFEGSCDQKIDESMIISVDNTDPEHPVTTVTPQEITLTNNGVSGDKYNITITPDPQDPNHYEFNYQLTGTQPIFVHKQWYHTSSGGTENPDKNSLTKIDFTLKKSVFPGNTFSDVDPQEIDIWADSDKEETDRITVNSGVKIPVTESNHAKPNGESWTVMLEVPMYDSDGHELEYQIKEESVPKYVTRYSYDKASSTYTVTNKYAPDPGNPEIELEKEWHDDGEQEYRKNLNISIDRSVNGNEPIISNGAALQESESWLGYVTKKRTMAQYQSDCDTAQQNNTTQPNQSDYADYHYNKDHFREYSTSSSQYTSQYKTLGEIDTALQNVGMTATEVSAVPVGNKWIYYLKSQYNQTTNCKSVADDNKVLFGDILNKVNGVEDDSADNNTYFAGIYQDIGHYYAVQQKRNYADNTSHITFINTRIGVVSFEVEFDWQVGNWLESFGNEQIEVEITGKVGNAVVGRYNENITISDTKKDNNSSQNKTFRITDLPKYDQNGKIITYEIKEVKIAGQTISSDGNYFNLLENPTDITPTNRCQVDIEYKGYDDSRSVSHSDDLIKYKITNTFSDNRSMTVYKRWIDDSNALGTRPDIFIRLMQQSENVNEGRLYRDYKWTDNNAALEGHVNDWTYTFSGLPKYDDNGYRYIYYVWEESVEKYHYVTSYDNHENNEFVNQINYAYHNGVIINKLTDTIQIDGEKLWSDISTDFKKQWYPVADVFLYAKKKYSTYTDQIDNAFTPTESTDRDKNVYIVDKDKGQRISYTKIYSGANSFYFLNPENTAVIPAADRNLYYVIDNSGNASPNTPKTERIKENDASTLSLVLPKYDENGALITYTLGEKSIDGFAFKISNQKIVNVYNGGPPILITVNKDWKYMTNQVYPTITYILHQVYYVEVDDGNEGIIRQKREHQFTKIQTDTNHENNWSYTFGLIPSEDIRTYAPNGTPYEYYITEKLTNYDGDEQIVEFYVDTANNLSNLLDPNDKSYSVLVNENGNGYHYSATGVEPIENTTNRRNSDGELYSLKKADLTNEYKPNLTNFQGKIYVNKSWQYHGNTNDYTPEKNYSFIISRKTKKIEERPIMKINTKLVNGLPTVVLQPGENWFHSGVDSPMTAYTAQGSTAGNGDTIAYYAETFHIHKEGYETDIPVTVKIDAETRNVEISGLAIFAEDAKRYTYIVTEQSSDIYKVASAQSAELRPVEVTTGNGTETVTKAEFALDNELKVFTLYVDKVFQKTYETSAGVNVTTDLDTDDYEQFFDESYLSRLKATLYRSTDQDKLNNNNLTDPAVNKVAENTPLKKDNDNRYMKRSGLYYWQFNNLPHYDALGNKYYYRVVEYTDGNALGDHVTSTPTTSFDGSFDGEAKTEKIYNQFEAKRITVDKYWDDDDNADGLRPEELDITIHETIPLDNEHQSLGSGTSKNINISKTLKNEDKWTMKVDLPKYYYNGETPVDGLKFSLEEALQNADKKNAYNLDPLHSSYECTYAGYYCNTYDRTNNSPTVATTGSVQVTSVPDGQDTVSVTNGGYFVCIDNSQIEIESVTVSQAGSDDELEGMFLVNKKNRLKGKITVSKKWANDDDLIWRVRPSTMYVVLQRREKYVHTVEHQENPNDPDSPVVTTTETDYGQWESAKYIDDTYVGTQKLVAGSDPAEYVYVLDLPSSGTAVTIDNLPFGKVYPVIENSTSVDATNQYNGIFKSYEYRVVECDKDGNVLLNENQPNFNYKWNSFIGADAAAVTAQENEAENADPKTYSITQSELDLKKTNDIVTGAELTSAVKNEFVPITHTMNKTWIDFDDYYQSRGQYYVFHLERKLESETEESAWIQLTTVTTQNETYVYTFCEAKYNNTDFDNLGGSEYSDYSSAYDSTKESMVVSKDTGESAQIVTSNQSHLFSGLPEYDLNGNKYSYRVVEDYIGTHPVTEHTYGSNNHIHGTFNYKVEDGHTGGVTADGLTTNIKNEIIPPENFVHIEAEKIWNDQNNQDGLRPDTIYFRLTQMWENEAHSTDTVQEANAANNWKVRWDNCPGYTPDGNIYSYYVDEVVKTTDEHGNDVYEEVKYTDTRPNPNDTPGTAHIDGYETTYNSVRYDTETDEGGNEIPVRVEPFTNSHTPQKQSLTVNKVWEDSDNANGLRPDKVKFELWCKYDLYKTTTDENGIKTTVRDTDEDGNPKTYNGKVSEALTHFNQTASAITSDDTVKIAQGNEWAVTYANLPSYINVWGDGRFEGAPVKVPVTYYVKEIALYDTTDNEGTQTDVDVTQVKRIDYKCADTSTDVSLTGGNGSVNVTNTLDTRNVLVKKTWNDQGYENAPHYDITVTLKNSGYDSGDHVYCTDTDINTDGSQNTSSDLDILTGVGITDANEQKLWVVFKDVPKYKNGEVIDYTVEEIVKGAAPQKTHEYGYVRADDIDSSDTDTRTNKTVLSKREMTNTLPIAQVNVTKEWDDAVSSTYNYYGLRPDSITLKLQRAEVSASTHNAADPNGREDNTVTWEDVKSVTLDSTADTSNALYRSSTAANWQYVFTNLLMYDENNTEYVFRVVEEFPGSDGGAYRVLYTSAQNTGITENRPASLKTELYHYTGVSTGVPSIDDADWSKETVIAIGDTPKPVSECTLDFLYEYAYKNPYYMIVETIETGGEKYKTSTIPSDIPKIRTDKVLDLENELKTQDVKLKKYWNDNGCSDNKRYDIKAEISNTVDMTNGTFEKTINAVALNEDDSTYVTYENVPVFKKDGTKIEYTLTEKAADDNTVSHYRYDKTLLVREAYGSNPQANASNITADEDNVLQYIVTNTLQKTDMTLTKTWNDQSNVFSLRPDNVTFKLYRTTNTNADINTQKGSAETDEASKWVEVNSTYYTIVKTDNNNNTWTVDFNDLRKFAKDNKPYLFMVEEVYGNGIKAYSKIDPVITSHSVSGTETTVAYDVSMTNTLITYDSIPVTKTWVDHTGLETYRYDITVNLSCSAISYDTDMDMIFSTNHETEKTVNFKSSTNAGLPKYNNDGTMIVYELTERVKDTPNPMPAGTTAYGEYDSTHHFQQLTTKNHYDGKCVMGTDTETVSGDGQSVTRTYITGFAVTNTMPVVHYKARKNWIDDNNRDGLRPDGSSGKEFDFTLTHKTYDVNSNAYGNSETTDKTVSASAESWLADLGYYPEYDDNNNAYQYYVNENNFYSKPQYYTQMEKNSPAMTAEQGAANVKVGTYAFTNEHNPFTSSLSLTKWWDDEAYKGYTRPTKITVRLKCKIEGETDWKNASEANYVKEFVTAKNPGYVFDTDLDTSSAVHDDTENKDYQTYTFSDLPLYVNISGNTSDSYDPAYDSTKMCQYGGNSPANGISKNILYYIEEIFDKELTGYTAQYSSSADVNGFSWALNEASAASNGKSETITNQLRKQDITVSKSWNKQTYAGEDGRYPVTLRVYSNYAGAGASNYDQQKTTTDTAVTFADLPLYDKNGDPAVYFLEELQTSPAQKKYGYFPTYTTAANGLLPNGEFRPTIEQQQSLLVTNTLPLAQVEVTKKWEDYLNRYGLRPDSITLKLQRAEVSAVPHNAAVPNDRDDSSVTWADIASVTLNSTVDTSNALYRSSTATNWQYVFTNLLMYDENNTEYVFRIVEEIPNGQGGAYKTVSYTTPLTQNKQSTAISLYTYTGSGTDLQIDSTDWQVVPNITSGGSSKAVSSCTFDELYNYAVSQTEYYKIVEIKNESGRDVYKTSTIPKPVPIQRTDKVLDLENELKTQTVKVKKEWEDNGCTDSDLEHYDINVKISAADSTTNTGLSDSSITSLVFDTDIPKTAGTLSDEKTISGVPVKDKTGNNITYVPAERPKDKSGYTAADTHYGYEKSYYETGTNPANPTANYTFTVDETNGAAVTVRNTLPVTDVTVNKTWELSDQHKYGKSNVTIDVYRSSSAVSENKIETNQTLPVDSSYVNDGTHQDTVTFNHHLQKDINNNVYTYRAQEVGKYQGFEPVYTNAQSAASATSTSLSIHNKQIRGNAQFTKIDGTYERMYNNSSYNYQNDDDIKLSGAVFRLYLNSDTSNASPLYVQQVTGGYEFVDQTAAASDPTGYTQDLVSDSNGRIALSKMPLNTFKLVETTPPTGYVLRTAPYEFTIDVIAGNEASNSTGDSKIRNEQDLGSAKLTKVDKNNSNAAILNNSASYYLLRLIPFEVCKTGTTETTKTSYETNANNAVLHFNGSVYTDILKYWDIAGSYQTDNIGEINVSELPFGTYRFMEIQAPTGYFVNYNFEPFTINSSNRGSLQDKSHEDERRPAYVKIFKRDEFNNGLDGATFKLYKKIGNDPDPNTDLLIATIVTGDDGMNGVITTEAGYVNNQTEFASVRASDNALKLEEWTHYYFVEYEAPAGYNINGYDPTEPTATYQFEVTKEVADEIVHIVRAKDERIKGKVTLTKVAGERVTVNNNGTVETYLCGQPLAGAKFKLYKKDSDDPEKMQSVTDNTVYSGAYYVPAASGSEEMEVSVNGTLHIEGLEWGEYYLLESKAPEGFAKSVERIEFSVGRNNCTADQQLTCKNMGDKAQIKIVKRLDEYRENWGTPTFIFKIKRTDVQNGMEKTVMVTMKQDQTRTDTTVTPNKVYYYAETEDIDVEPGSYEVSEIQTSRYYADVPGSTGSIVKASDSSTNAIADDYSDGKFVFDLESGDIATLDFLNKIRYYDKFSHTDSKNNEFKGIKSLYAAYPNTLETYSQTSANPQVTQQNGKYYLTLSKNYLTAYFIDSSGKRVSVPDVVKQNITISKGDASQYDPRFDVINNTDGTFKVVCDPWISAGCTYTLKADYDYTYQRDEIQYTEHFTTNFDIVFKERDTSPKIIKNVVFKADPDRYSYFKDSSITLQTNGRTDLDRTDSYTLSFVFGNEGNSKTLISIMHNGNAVSNGFMNEINNSLTVNKTVSEHISKNGEWANGDAVVSYNDGTLKSLVQTAVNSDDFSDLVLTAVLKHSRTVTFNVDENNRSYFAGPVYSYVFDCVTSKVGSSNVIRSISHDGTVINSETDFVAAVNGSLSVVSTVSGEYAFNGKWKYGTDAETVLTSDDVRSKLITTDIRDIVYTAVLDPVPNP